MPTSNAKTPIRAAKPNDKAGFMHRIVDTLTNLVSGMGGEKDKLAGTQFALHYLNPAELDAAFRTDWIARKLVTIPAFDATREWRAWQGDEDDITKLEDAERSLGIQRKTMQAITKGRQYGGGALILGVNQGRNEEELDYSKIKEGDLQFVHAVSRYDVGTGAMIRDIGSPYFGEPEYYERTSTGEVPKEGQGGQSFTGTRFHPSRVIRFVGNERLDSFSTGDVWGDSILQAAADAIKSAGVTANSSAQLVGEAKVDIIRIPGLSEGMSSTEYEKKLTARFAMANMIKGVYSMLLLDKEEEWERHNATFTGLPDIMQMMLLMASGAGDVPATRFLSQSPAGLSSTGESDLRNYYDNVGSVQKVEISPALARLDNVLIPSALGTHPDELFYVWNSLWQMTPKEKAEVDKSKADTFKIDVDSNLIDTVVLKKARENQIIEDNVYPGFESIRDDFDGQGDLEAAQAAAAAGLPDPSDPDNDNNERSEDDPNANPDKMNEEGEGDDPASKPTPKKKKLTASDRRRMRDGISPGTFKSMRKRLDDATPRTLYMRRDLLPESVTELKKWAKSQGFKSIVADLHVTITYSKAEFDWIKARGYAYGEDDKGNFSVNPGGPRVMEQFGKAQVLVFGNQDLTYRHMSLKDYGASSNFEDYNPHITISYLGVTAAELAKVKPYTGALKFGPEIWQEIDTGFDNDKDVEESKL